MIRTKCHTITLCLATFPLPQTTAILFLSTRCPRTFPPFPITRLPHPYTHLFPLLISPAVAQSSLSTCSPVSVFLISPPAFNQLIFSHPSRQFISSFCAVVFEGLLAICLSGPAPAYLYPPVSYSINKSMKSSCCFSVCVWVLSLLSCITSCDT